MTLRDNFEIWLNSQADPSAALAFIRDEYKTDEETKLAEFATAARALVPYDIKTLPEEKEACHKGCRFTRTNKSDSKAQRCTY